MNQRKWMHHVGWRIARWTGTVLLLPLAFASSCALVAVAHSFQWHPEHLVKDLAFILVPHEMYMFFAYYLFVALLALPIWLVLYVVFLELVERVNASAPWGSQ